MTDVQLSFPCPDESAPAEDDETAVEPDVLPNGWLSEFGF